MAGADLECVVVGAGVVGLAAARALQRAGVQTFLIEANDHIGMETSARNSEVIHAGIYYPQGSLKAALCVAGREQLYAYCAEKGVPHRRLGKLIVATSEAEVATLEGYKAAAEANGVTDLRWVDRAELRAREPEVAGVRALLSPSTGIIDSHSYMQALLHDFEEAGGHLVCKTRVERVVARGSSFDIYDDRGDHYSTRRLVNSAGLFAPAFAAKIEGLAPQYVPKAHFAIGHYYLLPGRSPFRQLIYPVAVTGGLGVHVTLDMAGQVRFGPDVRWIDAVDYCFDDARRADFVAAIQRYYPGLDPARLVPGYTGIRPKISGPDAPAADFVIQGPADHGIPGLINLFGIESPGLTASLAIGEQVEGQLSKE